MVKSWHGNAFHKKVIRGFGDFCCQAKHVVEQTVELLVSWGAVMIMGFHCNDENLTNINHMIVDESLYVPVIKFQMNLFSILKLIKGYSTHYWHPFH